MIEEERLNRFKHGRPNSVAGLWNQFEGKFGYFPWASVTYCLEAAGLGLDDLDAIIVGDFIWGKAAAQTLRHVVPIKDKSKIRFMQEPYGAVHHLHHAYSAFYASSFDSAAVLIIDGDGNTNHEGYEAESGYFVESRQSEPRLVFKNRYQDPKVPKSGIGWMYEQTTLLLGFGNEKVFIADPGKTMGLASYGRPSKELEAPWLEVEAQGHRIDFSGFKKWLTGYGHDQHLLDFKGGLATRAGGIGPHAENVAYKVQVELEKAVFALAEHLQKETGATNLCLAGGVALNSVANGLLLKKGLFENIFVQPAANDAGQALGLAYRGHFMLLEERAQDAAKLPIRPMRHAYAGRTYPQEEIQELLAQTELSCQRFDGEETLLEDAATRLAENKIIGWFQGGSELGPRALGHRSILANPAPPDMKDVLNARVKFREGFRPFAPAVLLERSAELFEHDGDSPYMLLVVPVREDWKPRVPAIVHVDGTARLQTVDREVEPLFHGLISRFEQKTGIPVLVNTSFNLRGMPIVESPLDALACFLFTEMDALYLGRSRVDRPTLDKLRAEWNPGWTPVVEQRVKDKSAMLQVNGPRGKRACVPVSPQAASLMLRVGPEATVAELLSATCGEGAAASDAEGVLKLCQQLARSGALRWKVGQLTVGSRDEGIHWWQKE